MPLITARGSGSRRLSPAFHPLHLSLPDELHLRVRFLSPLIVRVFVGKDAPNAVSHVCVSASGDVPLEGRPLEDHSRFEAAPVPVEVLERSNACIVLASEALVLRVHLDGDLRLSLARRDTGQVFYEDAPQSAYVFNSTLVRFKHTCKRAADEEFYGMGEASGPLNRAHRRYRVDAKDAMGYDADSTDPLYKHCPYLIALCPSRGCVAYSQLYDTTRRGTMDLGMELSAYRGLFRYFEQECSSFVDLRLTFGPDLPALCGALVQLVGAPAVPPAWAMGYLASSMAYTEAEDAQERLAGFLVKLEDTAMPCDGFHLSSGYTTDPRTGARMVFTWNRSKIPSPQKMFAAFEHHRVGVIANVKPWLLQDHPDYQKVAMAKGFMRKALKDEPLLERLWQGGAGTSAMGSMLDFTSPGGFAYWKSGLNNQLLALGCRAIWNDNNEFEIDDDDARVASGESVGEKSRALQTMLMARASRDALTEVAGTGKLRGLVVTRSGCMGTQRYASQTWSGDNLTSFEAMRGNVRQMLSLGLCGWPGSGMDVGGFAGSKVTEELFLKWVRLGVWLPRFSIHSSSWKEGSNTNEPWMFPEIVDEVREALRLRERLKVQLFSLHASSAETGLPVCRPLVLHYQADAQARAVDDQWLLGRDVLVSPLVKSGEGKRTVYVPGGPGDLYADFGTGVVYRGGTAHQWSSGLGKREPFLQQGVSVLIRVGGGLVLAGPGFLGRRHTGANEREVVLVANEKGDAELSWIEETSGARCAVGVTAGGGGGGGSSKVWVEGWPWVAGMDSARVLVRRQGGGGERRLEQLLPIEECVVSGIQQAKMRNNKL